ncbi:Vacuolar protein sorting-associated protein 5 [Linnemannia schmuckeri]|uniref:Vacuolar protein sorting-associated protein 5 n=1 Tax=Linnemannia schmuckeri TaxID=64567 RepID=A0A9P5RZ29_9FUNG|nr:Vacuolar protein sorting-associated protein 5 [Linnemannia schmuckeri]
MTSPTGSVSDLLATGGSGTGGSRNNNTDTLDASTFIDPFSESNPFADDDSIGGPPGLSSVGGGAGGLKASQSLNFHEYYPQSTVVAAEMDDGDGHEAGHGGGTEGTLYGANTTFQKSFSAMNLAGQQEEECTLSSSPYYGAGAATSGNGFEDYQQRTSHQYDSDGGQRYATGGGGHQRWSSVDSDHHDDVEESHHHHQGQQGQQQYQQYDQVPIGREGAGQFRPESTRSLGSQMSFRLPEAGAIPWFDITVGEPQKIGDVINPHIVYKVHIKTNSTAFKSSDFTVQRRYRDFLWLYNQLTTHNPGVIVPPVSEKHALGRFQDEFVESRRIALERCLRKMTAHPMLYGDPDLKLFLESESLVAEIKEKRQDSSKGFMTKFGETLSSATTFTKVHETDEWFESRRTQLDVLDGQLKSLLKAIEAIIKQRRDLGVASSEFGESIVSLAGTELNKPLANSLLVLGNLKIRIKELHDKQAHMDVLTLEHTVDEYIRTIGSIKITFMTRAKFNQNMVQAQNDLSKKKANFDKMSQPSRKTKPERLQQLQAEITEAEQRVDGAKKDFEEISTLIRQEFDRFDREKVEDFKQSVEAFLASMVKHQREIVGLWENYFRALNGTADDQQNPTSSQQQQQQQDHHHQQQQQQQRTTTAAEESTTRFGSHLDTETSLHGEETGVLGTSHSNDILSSNAWSA